MSTPRLEGMHAATASTVGWIEAHAGGPECLFCDQPAWAFKPLSEGTPRHPQAVVVVSAVRDHLGGLTLHRLQDRLRRAAPWSVDPAGVRRGVPGWLQQLPQGLRGSCVMSVSSESDPEGGEGSAWVAGVAA